MLDVNITFAIIVFSIIIGYLTAPSLDKTWKIATIASLISLIGSEYSTMPLDLKYLYWFIFSIMNLFVGIYHRNNKEDNLQSKSYSMVVFSILTGFGFYNVLSGSTLLITIPVFLYILNLKNTIISKLKLPNTIIFILAPFHFISTKNFFILAMGPDDSLTSNKEETKETYKKVINSPGGSSDYAGNVPTIKEQKAWIKQHNSDNVEIVNPFINPTRNPLQTTTTWGASGSTGTMYNEIKNLSKNDTYDKKIKQVLNEGRRGGIGGMLAGVAFNEVYKTISRPNESEEWESKQNKIIKDNKDLHNLVKKQDKKIEELEENVRKIENLINKKKWISGKVL